MKEKPEQVELNLLDPIIVKEATEPMPQELYNAKVVMIGLTLAKLMQKGTGEALEHSSTTGGLTLEGAMAVHSAAIIEAILNKWVKIIVTSDRQLVVRCNVAAGPDGFTGTISA